MAADTEVARYALAHASPVTAALRSWLAETLPSTADATAARIEVRAKLHGADARIDVRSIAGLDEDTRAAAEQVAKALATRVAVESAKARPPHVLVRFDLDSLVHLVTDAVLAERSAYGRGIEGHDRPVVVSFGSPGTNKPLHIGHLRVCSVGLSLARLLDARGHDVLRFQMLSDSGIHIAQAVTGYLEWGAGATPASTGAKGDHFVGSWYARFHAEAAAEVAAGAQPGVGGGDDPIADELEVAERTTLLHRRARETLVAIDHGDPEAVEAMRAITGWALDGIRETYVRLGVAHEFEFREHETLPLARTILAAALERGDCEAREDGSVRIVLPSHGELTLMRGDGTPVAFTQFLGTWVHRARLHPDRRMVLVAGEQWAAGIAALFGMLRLFGHPGAADAEHATIGMVSMADRKLSSRGGTAMTADAILDGLRDALLATWNDPAPDAPGHVRVATCDRLAVGIMKYYLLSARRGLPMEYGETPLAQRGEAFAALIRTMSRGEAGATGPGVGSEPVGDAAAALRRVVVHIDDWGDFVRRAAAARDSSLIVRYLDDLVQLTGAAARIGPLPPVLWHTIAIVVRNGLDLLAIDPPQSLRFVPPAYVARGGLPQVAPPAAAPA